MNNVILACEILKDEINKALIDTGNQNPVIWLDSYLHMHPQKLHDKLQEEIDGLDRQGITENILFTFGYCGNAIIGLRSKKSNLIIPRVNDCIELFLSSNPEKDTIRSQGCYFLTRGWLESPYSMVNEYDHYINKYGTDRAKRIMKIMLANYRYLTMINTECYDIEAYRPIVEEAAGKLELELSNLAGDIQLLIDLFSYNWNKGICIIPPGEVISTEHFAEIDLVPQQGLVP